MSAHLLAPAPPLSVRLRYRCNGNPRGPVGVVLASADRPGEECALDEDIIRRAQQGDPAAFAEIVRAHQEAAFRVAYLIVRNEEDAGDVAQEAFVRAHGALRRFDRGQPLRPWLLRIVTNVALNSVRANRRRKAMGERYQQTIDQQAAAPSADQGIEASEQARRVWQAVGELEEHDQTLLYLRYFVGASEQETAAAIGSPVGTVKSRLHRVLRRLRDVVEKRYPDLVLDVVSKERADTSR